MACRNHRPSDIVNFDLRDYQRNVVQRVQWSRGQVISSPCGSGKTRIAIALAAGQSTLYISNNGALGKQLRESLITAGVDRECILFYSDASFDPSTTDLKNKILIASYAGVCGDKAGHGAEAKPRVVGASSGGRDGGEEEEEEEEAEGDVPMDDGGAEEVDALDSVTMAAAQAVSDAKWQTVLGHDWDLVVCDEAWHLTVTRMNIVQKLKTRLSTFMSGDYDKAKPDFIYTQAWMLLLSGGFQAPRTWAQYKGSTAAKAAAAATPWNRFQATDSPTMATAAAALAAAAATSTAGAAPRPVVDALQWKQDIVHAVLAIPNNTINDGVEVAEQPDVNKFFEMRDRVQDDITRDPVQAWTALTIKLVETLLKLFWRAAAVEVMYESLLVWPDPVLGQKQPLPVTAVVPIGLWMPQVARWHDRAYANVEPICTSVNPLRMSLVHALNVHHCGRQLNWDRNYRTDRVMTPYTVNGNRAIALFCLSVPAHVIWTAAFGAIPLAATATASDVLVMLKELNDVDKPSLRIGRPSPLAVMSMSRGVGLDTRTVRVGMNISSNYMNYIHMEVQQQGRAQRGSFVAVRESEGSIYLSFRVPTIKELADEQEADQERGDEEKEEESNVQDDGDDREWGAKSPKQRFVGIMKKLPALACPIGPVPVPVPVDAGVHSDADAAAAAAVRQAPEIGRTLLVGDLFRGHITNSLMSQSLKMNKRLFRAIFELVMCRVDYAHQHATKHMRQEPTQRWQEVDTTYRLIDHDRPHEELTLFWRACITECEVIQNHIKALEVDGNSRHTVPRKGWPWSKKVPLAPWEKTRWIVDAPDYKDQWWRFLYPHIVKGAVVEDWDPTDAGVIDKFRVWYKLYRETHRHTWESEGVSSLAKLQLAWWWKHTFAQFPPGSSELPWKDVLTAL
jgi:hypothetical protein